MTDSRVLPRNEWQPFFDQMSKELKNQQVEIEVNSLEIGSQVEVKWTPLRGLTYDPKSDVFEVLTDDLDHMIALPQEVHVKMDAGPLSAVRVVAGDGHEEIIQLKRPLALPGS